MRTNIAGLFHMLESDGLLDPDNDNHLFCLHFVYLPVINDILGKFARSWLNHKVRTAGNKTPLQLFIMGMQQIGGEQGTVASEYFESLGEVRKYMIMTDLFQNHNPFTPQSTT